MKKEQKKTQDPAQEDTRMPLTRRNYILLADEFNYAMFSWRRITLAPILVIGGFVIEIYAIMKRY